jgi:hypothetical protein
MGNVIRKKITLRRRERGDLAWEIGRENQGCRIFGLGVGGAAVLRPYKLCAMMEENQRARWSRTLRAWWNWGNCFSSARNSGEWEISEQPERRVGCLTWSISW